MTKLVRPIKEVTRPSFSRHTNNKKRKEPWDEVVKVFKFGGFSLKPYPNFLPAKSIQNTPK